VNEPILAHFIPLSMHPNTISICNTIVCWSAFFIAYITYKNEHQWAGEILLYLRIIQAILIFAGISLDCLDGMQARKTGKCSKLGEVLDHSLDAANVPLVSAALLLVMG
jgi:ethanolaminephosphotransferase